MGVSGIDTNARPVSRFRSLIPRFGPVSFHTTCNETGEIFANSEGLAERLWLFGNAWRGYITMNSFTSLRTFFALMSNSGGGRSPCF